MQIEIKKTVKAGNSSAVLLPRSWLSKEVRVELIEKTPDKILIEVLELTKKHLALKDIVGIYLVGSYARQEETDRSDIDILIITNNIDKPLIKEGIYSILLVSEALLKQKLGNDLFPIGQMIIEAKSLINDSYLKSLKVAVTKKNVKWYITTTEEKLKLIKEILENAKNKIDNRIVYTLILRIRTLYIIEKLIKKQAYSSKEFISLINKIAGSQNAYNSYLAVKEGMQEEKITAKEESKELYLYLENQLKNIKNKVYK